MEREIKGIRRDRYLTEEEAARYARLRKLVEEEFPPLGQSPAGASGVLTEELRKAIRESGRTYLEIGKQAQVSALMIERFVMGEKSVPLEIADRLALALGLHLSHVH